jgi:hypothetical protein
MFRSLDHFWLSAFSVYFLLSASVTLIKGGSDFFLVQFSPHKNNRKISLTPLRLTGFTALPGLPNLHSFEIMLSFANAHLSFYLLFLICMAGLAASAPITYHRHHLNSPFPYGKLADKLLNVNDVSYIIDDLDEDMVRVYPENHSIPFSDLPIADIEPKPPVPINTTTPNVGSTNLFSFAYRIPDVIKKIVAQEWDTALVRWRTMARVQ